MSSWLSMPTNPCRCCYPTHFGNVLDQNRNAPLRSATMTVANVLGSAQQTYTPDNELLFALFDVSAAGIHVAVFQALEQLLHRDAVGFQLRNCPASTWYCLIYPPRAHDVGDSRNCLQITFDDKVLDAREVLWHRICRISGTRGRSRK